MYTIEDIIRQAEQCKKSPKCVGCDLNGRKNNTGESMLCDMACSASSCGMIPTLQYAADQIAEMKNKLQSDELAMAALADENRRLADKIKCIKPVEEVTEDVSTSLDGQTIIINFNF